MYIWETWWSETRSGGVEGREVEECRNGGVEEWRRGGEEEWRRLKHCLALSDTTILYKQSTKAPNQASWNVECGM